MVYLGKKSLLGVSVDAIDYEVAVTRIMDAAVERRSFTVSALAVHGLMVGAGDKAHRYRLNSLDLVVPDGQWVRHGLNWLHKTHLRDRVYGPELTLRVCAAMAEKGLPVYLYGSRKPVLEKLRSNLLARFPRLQIVGMRPSLFRQTTPEEKEAIAQEINESGARAVLVGLGCPRQEVWVFEYRHLLPMPAMAVGAAFDFHAGLLPQAPEAWQRSGFEWLYRLIQEPRRLWRRTALYPVYLGRLALQMAGLERSSRSQPRVPVEELRYG